MKLTIIILAAGIGKRMRSTKPKVLQELAGQSMIEHVLASARALAPDRLIVVVGHQAEQVKAHLAAYPEVQFALQDPPQGTGHAVLQALPLVASSDDEWEAHRDTTLVLYGDVPLVQPSTLTKLLQARGNGLAVLTEHLSDPTGYGRIVRDPYGHIMRCVEHKDATPTELAINEVNTGIMAIPTARLADWLGLLTNHNAQQEYYLTDLLSMATDDEVPIASSHPEHPWETLGVNNRLQQAQLERTFQREQARQLMEQGVHLIDPARLDIRGKLQCGQDVRIDTGCVFEGNVTLADNVQIGAFCVLKNCTLGAGTRVEPFTHIDSAQVGENVHIGPYARLRPGTELDNEVHIGNFTELKKTRVGTGSKANHLSYLGDADIGSGVNVGAGVITCNYDGVNKFKTTIGDGCFIGSDSQLIAPISVGAGSTIAAGSTVWKDVPEGGLVRNPKTQEHDAHWQPPQKPDKT